MDHANPDLERLLAFAAGELPPHEAEAVAEHLLHDARAAGLVERYRLAAETLRTDDSIMPSEALRAKARAIFEPDRLPRRPSLLGQVREIVATLIFDSRVQPAGVRYADTGQRLQLSYETAEADIDLQAERTDSAWRLRGQISGDDAAMNDGFVPRIIVRPQGGGEAISSADADRSGMFQLEVAPGKYDLHIEGAGEVIVLPELRLG